MNNKAIRYRIYPNKEQKILLAKTFGCVRKVYNLMLSLQIMLHQMGRKKMSKTKMNNFCNNVLKEFYPYLREVDKFALTNAIYNLEDAFKNFFEGRADFPKFKVKYKNELSYTTNITNNNIEIVNKGIKLPKLGIVKASIHRTAPKEWVLKSATISRTPADEYYVSVLYEYENQVSQVEPVKILGLDYSSEHLFVDSTGFKLNYPRYYRQAEEKLAREQRKLSKMKEDAKKRGQKLEDCKNYQKQRVKVAKLHRKVANCRKDLLHKLSYIIAENYDAVAVEDIDMKAIAQSLNLGKSTMDNGFGKFRDMLKYKLEDRGKQFVKVDRFFPSSQLCHCCGYKNPAVKDMHVREWDCPDCGEHHDRDINAAINLREEAKRLLAV